MAPIMALVACAALFALQHTTHALPALQQVNRDLINNVVIHESPVSTSTEPTSASSWNQDSDAFWRLDPTDQNERSGLGDGKLWQSGQRNDKRAPQCGGPTGSPLLQKIREHREKIREELERLKKKKGDRRMEEMDAKSIEDKEERESKLKAIEAEMKQVDEDITGLIWRPWGGPPQCIAKRAVADVAGKDDPTLQELNKEYWRLVKKEDKLLKKKVKFSQWLVRGVG